MGKIRDQHALILIIDPRSTQNIIPMELAENMGIKLGEMGIKLGEMGPTLEAKGAFKGHEVAVTPLIGKLQVHVRVHVQSFVEPEVFYVAPLQFHDVILGAPWFHRLLKFPKARLQHTTGGKDR